jgi:hypothetical protein
MSGFASQRRLVQLDSPMKKIGLVCAVATFAIGFLSLATCEFLAWHYANRADLPSLRRAIRLSPRNADYHLMLARYLSATAANPSAVAAEYRTATRLNPHDAEAWLELAGTAQVLEDASTQRWALERAVAMDPTTPQLAWQAGSFFLVQGDTDQAFREFRVVVSSDPPLRTQALDLATHAADIDTIIRQVLPPQADAYLDFLVLLMSKKDSDGAAKVWSGMTKLGQAIEQRPALAYVNYLILQRQVNAARTAWRQTLRLAGLSGYDNSSSNLIVNANFDSEILNNGFDWHYSKLPDLNLALDPNDFHAGHRSLSIVFDGPGVNDAGVFQFVAVEPDTPYDFSAYYKTENMDGAGGPRLSLSDAYTGATYYLSDDLKNAEMWREASGTFTTGAETELLLLRVLRIPGGSPIRGHLWLDDFRLSEKHP